MTRKEEHFCVIYLELEKHMPDYVLSKHTKLVRHLKVILLCESTIDNRSILENISSYVGTLDVESLDMLFC